MWSSRVSVSRSGRCARGRSGGETLRDKGICGSPEAIHGLVGTLTESDNPIKDWPGLSSYGLSAQSFHPKIAGARLYADRLQATMAGWTL